MCVSADGKLAAARHQRRETVWGRRGEPACLDAGQHGISDAKMCLSIHLMGSVAYVLLDIVHTLLEKVENTH